MRFSMFINSRGNRNYLAASREALAFERRCFDPNQQNWRDLRKGTSESASVAGCVWCHGAPGIGLARLRTREFLPEDSVVREKVKIAVATTVRALGFGPEQGTNCSLCHGVLGNAVLPVLAAQVEGMKG
jgi:lantibiotic biosynthesis protein